MTTLNSSARAIKRALLRVACLSMGLSTAVSRGDDNPSVASPPEPAWKRLGVPVAPSPDSGQGIGVVMIDQDWAYHKSYEQRGKRLWLLDANWLGRIKATQPNLLPESDRPKAASQFSHWAKSLRRRCHPSFSYQGQEYIGLAPGATYFVVPFAGREQKPSLCSTTRTGLCAGA